MVFPRPALFDREMNRAEFLKAVGIGLLLLVGGRMVLGALQGMDRINRKAPSGGPGYGSSGYGK